MRGLIGDGGELEGGSKRGMGRDREGGDDKSWEEWDMEGIELEEGSGSSSSLCLLPITICLSSQPCFLLLICNLGRVGS